jgi:hypothetical protein
MDRKQVLVNWFRGWLPKEVTIAHSVKRVKPRWRNPAWLAFTVVTVCALTFAGFIGIQTYIRYSNPQADVTASYFEKTLNCTQATFGDVVEVNVLVGWHSHILPEFKRQVKIVDAYPNNFELINGNVTRQYSGYGGGDQFQYQLKVTNGNGTIELPKPKLYLDNTLISLNGQTPRIQLS